MITVSVDKSIAKLAKALGEDAPKKLKKEVAIAINAVAKSTRNGLAKEVAKELAVSQKQIKDGISVSHRAKLEELSATVTQKESARIPLKQFGARQNKQGVRYKISKTKGTKFIKSAFQSERLGNHVFKRESKSRLPIQKLYGPSAWGITTKNDLDDLIAKRDVEPELIKQVERRIKAVNFKKSQG